MTTEERVSGLNLSELEAINYLYNEYKILIQVGNKQKVYYANPYSIYDIANLKSGAVLRRNFYRGISLGTAVTDEQWEEIRNGTFRNMFIGDYWEIGGILWRIVDFNYIKVSQPNVMIQPITALYAYPYMNEGFATGGYVGSDIHKTGLDDARSIIRSAFGSDHILKYNDYLSNAANNEYVTGSMWTEVDVTLPNADMLGLDKFGKVDGDHVYYLPFAITRLNGYSNEFSNGSIASFMGTRDLINSKIVIGQWVSRTTSSASVNSPLAVRPVFAIYSA